MHVTTRSGPWGFDVEATISFSDSRVWRAGSFELAGRSYPAALYPNDGTDNDGPPRPLVVKAGVTVTVTATVAVGCARAVPPPTMVIRSQPDGGPERVDRFTTDDPRVFAAGISAWCELGVQATVQSSTYTPSGNMSFVLKLLNPQTTAVTVSSAAYTSGTARWDAARVTVPPSSSRLLHITGTVPDCSGAKTPWQTGHLSAAGSRLTVADGGGSWC